jgi:hypothetical protein
MTIYDLLDECSTGDPDADAVAVLARVKMPQASRDLLLPLVRQACRHHQRQAALALEADAARDIGRMAAEAARGASSFAPVPAAPSLPAGGDHSPSGTHRANVAARREWLDSRFYNGSRYVTWRSATVADHEGRVALLDRLIAGTEKTRARHLLAVQTIREAGVTCLGEIDGDVLTVVDAA